MAHAYPKDWEAGRNGTIAHRHLEEFKYAEITYDIETNKYQLWKTNHDGPTQREKHGQWADLEKAFKAGNNL